MRSTETSTRGPICATLDDVNLHDWIDEVCDTLDLEIEVDEGLLLDLTKIVADNVQRPAAPVTAYLLGYAAGLDGAGPDDIEQLAGRVQTLAEGWDRPHGVSQQRSSPADAADDPDGDAIPDDVAEEFSHELEEAEAE